MAGNISLEAQNFQFRDYTLDLTNLDKSQVKHQQLSRMTQDTFFDGKLSKSIGI